ncbi:bifunctional phosphopantothenoylcysteine decarboxylase/phosphopantothenate--cysteine ligase CoaBC [Salisediminibacterium halotolerans]|uniref:bifunctional phosphopantothenoylcysteine decarboxylase/phosphopantothenate--cysteine ligase CoaBC n=1 Tax=Salisediminibacterium halotolerans TaxID=517425 RepID=UPI000EB4681A|nr:bifunctional phosphopantothenoylcysteine decarboxylase/phosphopantothenate--cysteine ligase CoaBC [Salisediminibacterium halotolerans]RLJ74277.1 phosphopantothenate-cysteine ligase /phosphopantothenoylcysteine decarboxylase [Actinophytocola xinjiangensis]RPE87631.1 phosphopantothenate-cysteine ligase /phosphopantothenoylcysteine decarboxylase [Salisediminibacterium halotolerans]TWG35114.1 phosphopantothenate-cysteine ligase /phosphopantothenoylcysteine decarboxylase [Salisediminibacterium hal
MSEKKHILLCVTGGIAVFKAAALTSKLTQDGYQVKVVMTESAREFVTPLTFQALSREVVYENTFYEPDPSSIAHIDIADWADLVVIAPATANIIGKLAHGLADDMVSTTLLASTAPVMIAPAMNVHMYAHPAVTRNLTALKEMGCEFIEPDEGYLACGYSGKGRMAEPEDLHAMIDHHFIRRANPQWHGLKVLVTAGPTQEKVDPVRFVSNRSSGKMGFAIAEEAAARGADVTLIAGPVGLPDPHGVKRVDVTSAAEMYEQVHQYYGSQDVVIKAAAVSDYRPANVAEQKVKKSDDGWTLPLERTADILQSLGAAKKGQYLVGFAAESEHIEYYAKKKLSEKGLDLIAANSIVAEGSGFDGDTNALMLYDRDGNEVEIRLTAKRAAAKQLLDAVQVRMGAEK